MKFIRLVLAIIGCYIIVAVMPIAMLGQVAQAHHLLPQHQLKCSDNFPCPKELQRRIDFWIQVFKSWDKKIAIFHDPNIPERVYSVVDTGEGCYKGVSKKIAKERKRLKTTLYNVAAKVESKTQLKSSADIHFAELFTTQTPNATPKSIAKKMRAASKNIRCQSGVKDSFLAGLQRFNHYQYLVDTVLKQYQLPAEIRYLPFVESSYNPAAYSKAGAAGMWQIMPRTARTLGLELNATIDERLDPEAATHAAAKYLVKSRKSLIKLAKSIDPNITEHEINPFVITSYNYGLNGMRRAIRSIKPDYLSVLQNYKSPHFQVAVKNFYSSFLAARHVTLNAQKYFGDIAIDKPTQYQTLVLKHPTSLKRIKSVFKVTEKQLKPLNLGLTRFVWNDWRMIPAGYQLKLPGYDNQHQNAIAKLESMAPETVVSGSSSYIVRKGDTACGIARALEVNCRALININQLGKRAIILIGQKLSIPEKLAVVAKSGSRGSDQSVVIKSSQPRADEIYRVRRGDTACKIAQRFNVGCRVLISANRLNRKATIYVGQKLTIPGVAAQSQHIANLDENNRYTVRKGDSACSISSRFSVDCIAFRRLNNLNKVATIFPGQKLKIPGLEVPDTTETAQQLAQVDLESATTTATTATATETETETETETTTTEQAATYPTLSNLLDTLPDFSISITGSAGNPVYRIRVEADETLGYYSDWLGLGSTKAIRRLNKLPYGQTLPIGRILKLPLTSGVKVPAFERKRIEYHQLLSESLKEHFSLTGVEQYIVQSGDGLWSLSRRLDFPVWLAYRLNPDLNLSSLKVGQVILLPKLQKK